jgi:hypothetical protein
LITKDNKDSCFEKQEFIINWDGEEKDYFEIYLKN